MVSHTVIISDTHGHDEGVRGTTAFWAAATRFGAYAELGLYWFLTEYYGRSQVRLLRPSQLLEADGLSTDYLFVGLPTRVSKAHLENIQFRRLVLYDATDQDEIQFGYSDRDFLLSETDLCLKNWRDSRWRYDFRVGLLPIKRAPLNKLPWGIRRQQLRETLRGRPAKRFDVGFVARPTGDVAENPRVRWLIELKKERPDLNIWGGLVGSRHWRNYAAQRIDKTLVDSLWLDRKKIGFFEYFAGLNESKVALAPRGFAPWSYRHYEAIYARSLLVCNDLSHYELLVPLPETGVVQVPEGESPVEGVEQALKLYDESPELADENRAHMEKWLRRGHYCRSRTDLRERFESQLRAA